MRANPFRRNGGPLHISIFGIAFFFPTTDDTSVILKNPIAAVNYVLKKKNFLFVKVLQNVTPIFARSNVTFILSKLINKKLNTIFEENIIEIENR